LTRGISKSFNFVLRVSNSVCHSFNFVFDQIRTIMASANDNSAQLQTNPGFLHSPIVLSRAGLYAAYLAAKVLAV
jgi:hypothetical protein